MCVRRGIPDSVSCCTPDMGNRIPDGAAVAGDNACYSNPEGYSDDRYLAHLDRFPRDRCLFAPAPDVVGDHLATVERSSFMLRRIRAAGFPSAFCAQDGWNEETTPWNEFDVLFIGGTTEFKFRGGREARAPQSRAGSAFIWAGSIRDNGSGPPHRSGVIPQTVHLCGSALTYNTPKVLAWIDPSAPSAIGLRSCRRWAQNPAKPLGHNLDRNPRPLSHLSPSEEPVENNRRQSLGPGGGIDKACFSAHQ